MFLFLIRGRNMGQSKRLGGRRASLALRIGLPMLLFASLFGATTAQAQDTIKVGILHSLSGTMSISEVSVKDAELMAIDEINAAGGVLGKKLEPIVEDGAS